MNHKAKRPDVLSLNVSRYTRTLADGRTLGKEFGSPCMRLTIKLISVLTLLAVGLVALHGYLTVQREVDLFEAEMRADHHRLATAMEVLVVQIWRLTSQSEALERIKRLEAGEQRVRIRWVWLDAETTERFGPRVTADQLQIVRTTRGEVSFHKSAINGPGELLTYYRIDIGAERTGALELSESLRRRDDYTRSTMMRTLWLMLGLIIVSALIIGLVGVRMIGRPLQALAQKARRVGLGDLNGPIHLRGRDELSELADAFNEMCERLDEAHHATQQEAAERIATLEQLRHADRLRTVGRLASGVAHELGTPLNVVSGRADMIAGGRLSKEEVLDGAQAIKSEADRMTGIIRHLLDFARRSTPNRTTIDLRTVTEQTLSLLAPLAHKRGATLTFVGDSTTSFVALVDSGQIQQVLSNLVVNGLQSREEGATVTVGLRVEHVTPPEETELDEGDYHCLFVQDDGTGISSDVREHLFEPFFTTKGVGEGSGLGLSIAYGIVTEHGGWIDVTSEVDHGSCFSVYLPRESET